MVSATKLLWFRACHGEDLWNMPFASSLAYVYCVYHTLYTMERKILSQHPCHFDINLALYNLEINLGLQKPPPWSPFFQSKCRTIRVHACSMVEGIASTAVTKCVVSVQLEPKVAILKCCDFRWPAASLEYWNMRESCHDFKETKMWSSPRFPSGTFNFQAKDASDVIKSGTPSLRPSKRKWTAGRPPASEMGNVRMASHGFTRWNLKGSLN